MIFREPLKSIFPQAKKNLVSHKKPHRLITVLGGTAGRINIR
jgi:hypothetical protein